MDSESAHTAVGEDVQAHVRRRPRLLQLAREEMTVVRLQFVWASSSTQDAPRSSSSVAPGAKHASIDALSG